MLTLQCKQLPATATPGIIRLVDSSGNKAGYISSTPQGGRFQVTNEVAQAMPFILTGESSSGGRQLAYNPCGALDSPFAPYPYAAFVALKGTDMAPSDSK